ncbi:MAG: dihydropyrimidinase [Deltaproteobacteria bacterium]|nr:dihydropyrimidinase [Deltaproteobacteria bacterium]
MGTLIKNGTIVTAAEQYTSDVLIEGEKIVAIGAGLDERAETIIDAEGKYLFPGGIDAHSHFDLPFMGTNTAGFDTTPAAIVGGTTSVIDFTPQPAGMSLQDSIVKHREEAIEGKTAVDYSLHSMVMDTTVPGIFDEFGALVKSGIPTIKLFLAYKGTPFNVDDATLYKALEAAKDVGMLAMTHAENGDIVSLLQQKLIAEGKTAPKYHAESRPAIVEAEATARAASLAKAADAPIFIVHVSCEDAMLAIRNARQQGVDIFGESCPQYLVLDVDYLAKPGFEGAKYVCSPALRHKSNQDPLWRALNNGWLQTVGSDHCGFNMKGQKEMGMEQFTGIPNGTPGVENRLAILYTYGVLTGKLSLQRMVDVFATAPAKFFGMYPHKGSIVVGGDADIVIFDPTYVGKISVETSLHGVDYSAYEGFDEKGKADKVFLRGNLVADGGKYSGQLGQGQFIERQPYGLAYQSRMNR